MRKNKKNKIIKKITVIAILVVFVAMVIAPFVFWVNNPDFTRMQIFLKFKYHYAAMLLIGFFGQYLINIKGWLE